MKEWCRLNGWKVVLFEGETGAPRTGIVDAVMVRIKPGDANLIEVRLVQLNAGSSGGREAPKNSRRCTRGSRGECRSSGARCARPLHGAAEWRLSRRGQLAHGPGGDRSLARRPRLSPVRHSHQWLQQGSWCGPRADDGVRRPDRAAAHLSVAWGVATVV